MYHNIAIVQNEKELFKYSFVDWKSIFSNAKELASYKCKFFDEHNIGSLFEENDLNYDAIFFAMNALDSKEIYDACLRAKDKIRSFLDAGNGLFIGYSSKQNKREFLPEQYQIHQHGRDLSRETQNDGNICLCPDTSISHMLNFWDSEKYMKAATEHMTIKGLYFSYLVSIDHFKSVIVDHNYETVRTLLAVSDATSNHRIVVTTLPIDWQSQLDILINIIKYCAEGIPLVVVLSKKNTSNLFDREYLFRQMGLYKIPYSFKSVPTINSIYRAIQNYEVIIFDSTWDEQDIKQYCQEEQKTIINNNLRIFHFLNEASSKKSVNQLYQLSIHSAYQNIDKIEKEVLLYLINKMFDNKNTYVGYSILSEIEAIKIQQKLGHYRPDIYARIIEDIASRIQKDGSYATMFVASCDAIHLLSLCENVDLPDKLRKIANDCKNRLQFYIQNTLFDMKDNIKNVNSYELASGLYYLQHILPINREVLKVFINKLIETLLEIEGSEITGFPAQTCLNVIVDNIDIVKERDELGDRDKFYTIRNLAKKCAYAFGDIESDYKVASIANYVSSLSKIVKGGFFSKEPIILNLIHRSLFAAVDYLYKSRNVKDSSWDNDIYATCLATQALSYFNELSAYPIDELLILLNNYCVNKNIITIDGLVELAQEQEQKIIKANDDLHREYNERVEIQKQYESVNNKLNETEANHNTILNQKEQTINNQKSEIDSLKNKHSVWRAVFFLMCTLFILSVIMFVTFAIYVGHSIDNVIIDDNFDYLWLLHEFFVSESGIAQIIIGVGSIVVEISLFMLFFFKDRVKSKQSKKEKKEKNEKK